jgi:anion-transporting  ArsA/GET3 family ATPase
MRTRPYAAAAAVAAVLSLAGCGGSEDKPSSAMTEFTVPCARFSDTAKKITDAQAELYSGTGGTKAVDALVKELDALKDGAPADVKDALAEMSDAFAKAQRIMADPTQASAAELAKLGPKLSADSQKITAYIVQKCS